MEKIGIDVHKLATQVCILTDDGEYKEFRIRKHSPKVLPTAVGRVFCSRRPRRANGSPATFRVWGTKSSWRTGRDRPAALVQKSGGARVLARRDSVGRARHSSWWQTPTNTVKASHETTSSRHSGIAERRWQAKPMHNERSVECMNMA